MTTWALGAAVAAIAVALVLLLAPRSARRLIREKKLRIERFKLKRKHEEIAAAVFAINHRSNTDYLLVAHMLFKFISLSYAVGEWARVWPLNHVFKWFGGYFVRRRYREQLYHAVLAPRAAWRSEVVPPPFNAVVNVGDGSRSRGGQTPPSTDSANHTAGNAGTGVAGRLRLVVVRLGMHDQ